MSDPNVAEAAQTTVPTATASNVPDHELVLEPDEQLALMGLLTELIHLPHCRNLKPGGYLELIEVDPFLNCDDGTLKPDHSVMKTLMLLMEAAQKLGAAYQDPKELKSMMIEAGFTDVIMQQLKWPTNPWPKEKRYKELGMWGAENMDEGWEAICMAPLTRAFGWTREEVLLMMVQNRKDFHDKNIHAYISIWAIHGKKPEKEAA
ncbi:hypothetical protein KNSL1_003910 [Colletotrichum chrysophilum]|nr:hypothetical protein KNSL1_003910 [Colletotrichum chrysophilum]